MKTQFMAMVVGAAVLLQAGCMTTESGKQLPDPILTEAIVQSAAATGAIIYLEKHPEQRDKFVTVRAALQGIIAAGNGNAAELQRVLRTLPIEELKGEKGTILITNAVVIINALGQRVLRVNDTDAWNYYVLPVAQGMVAGLDQALAQ